ncbi:MAG: hypothetical protein IJ107_00050 [Lachnospiraceae bacterium]|nr:hypothetical protein [Lachnospiraceae bacterium]
MKKKTASNSRKNTHRVLAAYWICKMISGGNPLKTTLEVLRAENRQISKERQSSREMKKRDKERKADPKRASLAAGALRHGIVKKILKAGRVY